MYYRTYAIQTSICSKMAVSDVVGNTVESNRQLSENIICSCTHKHVNLRNAQSLSTGKINMYSVYVCVSVCRTFSRKFRMIAFPRIIIRFTPYLFGFMFCFLIRFAHLCIISICSLPLSHRVYRTLTIPHFWLSLHFQHFSLSALYL